MKRQLLLATALAAAMALGACSTTPGGSAAVDVNSAKTAVFQAEGAYRTALAVAVTYRELPRCGTPAKQPCSDPKVVAQLQKAALAARESINAAEALIYSPGLGNNIAADAANAALTTARLLTNLTATLGK